MKRPSKKAGCTARYKIKNGQFILIGWRIHGKMVWK